MAREKFKIDNRTGSLNLTDFRQNTPEYLVLHSTRSYPEFKDVLRKHRENGWAGVGYHLFISKSGKISQARPFNLEGAHALGFNTNSIGISIYSENGSLGSKRIKKGKQVIDYLNSEFGKLPLIPHTSAQLNYINRLFRESGLKKQFQDDPSVVNKRLFQEIKSDLNQYLETLPTSKYEELKQRIKLLVNCPGELFNNFI